MEWSEIISEHCVGHRPFDNTPIYHYSVHAANLRAHLIASWACVEELQKQVKELKEWKHSVINRTDE